ISAPRKKLPPPTTMHTPTPSRTTSAISVAMRWTTSGSTPTLPPPNTSPESLISTRWYAVTGRLLACGRSSSSRSDRFAHGKAGCGCSRESSATGLPDTLAVVVHLGAESIRSGADLETDEGLDRRTVLVEDGLDRLLVLHDRRLLEQHDVLEEPVQP